LFIAPATCAAQRRSLIRNSQSDTQPPASPVKEQAADRYGAAMRGDDIDGGKDGESRFCPWLGHDLLIQYKSKGFIHLGYHFNHHGPLHYLKIISHQFDRNIARAQFEEKGLHGIKRNRVFFAAKGGQ